MVSMSIPPVSTPSTCQSQRRFASGHSPTGIPGVSRSYRVSRSTGFVFPLRSDPIHYPIHWVLPNCHLSVLRHWAFWPRPKHSTRFSDRKFFKTRRIISTLTFGHADLKDLTDFFVSRPLVGAKCRSRHRGPALRGFARVRRVKSFFSFISFPMKLMKYNRLRRKMGRRG